MTIALNTLQVRVPLAIRCHGGRKVIICPDGTPLPTTSSPARSRADATIVKALASVFRWKRMLENGRHASISEIAATEKIDRGYVGSALRLTLLAPDIVEVILDGRQPQGLALPRLLRPWPLEWQAQRRAWGLL